jgi:hypothetical protein
VDPPAPGPGLCVSAADSGAAEPADGSGDVPAAPSVSNGAAAAAAAAGAGGAGDARGVSGATGGSASPAGDRVVILDAPAGREPPMERWVCGACTYSNCVSVSPSPTCGLCSASRPRDGTQQRVVVPEEFVEECEAYAQANTTKGIETLVYGLTSDPFSAPCARVTHMYIPEQVCTPDSCEDVGGGVAAYCEEHGLRVVLWWHSHPKQLNSPTSVDVHTHAQYQSLFSGAVSIISAPCDPARRVAAYCLTEPFGLTFVETCSVSALEHHVHPPNVWSLAFHVTFTASDSEHIVVFDERSSPGLPLSPGRHRIPMPSVSEIGAAAAAGAAGHRAALCDEPFRSSLRRQCPWIIAAETSRGLLSAHSLWTNIVCALVAHDDDIEARVRRPQEPIEYQFGNSDVVEYALEWCDPNKAFQPFLFDADGSFCEIPSLHGALGIHVAVAGAESAAVPPVAPAPPAASAPLERASVVPHRVHAPAMLALVRQFVRGEIAREAGVDFVVSKQAVLVDAAHASTRVISVSYKERRLHLPAALSGHYEFACKFGGKAKQYDSAVRATPRASSATGQAPGAGDPFRPRTAGARASASRRAAKRDRKTAVRTGSSVLLSKSGRRARNVSGVRVRKSQKNGCPARLHVTIWTLGLETCTSAAIPAGSFIAEFLIDLNHDASAVYAEGGGAHVPFSAADLARMRTLPVITDAFDAAVRRGSRFDECVRAARSVASEYTDNMGDGRYYMSESKSRGRVRELWKHFMGITSRVARGSESELLAILKALHEVTRCFLAFRYPDGDEMVQWSAGPAAAVGEFYSQSSRRWSLFIVLAGLGELANEMACGLVGADTKHGVTKVDLALTTVAVTDVRGHGVPAGFIVSLSEETEPVLNGLRCFRHVIPNVMRSARWLLDDGPALLRAVVMAVPNVRAWLCHIHVADSMQQRIRALAKTYSMQISDGTPLHRLAALLSEFRTARSSEEADAAQRNILASLGVTGDMSGLTVNWPAVRAFASAPQYGEEDFAEFDNSSMRRTDAAAAARADDVSGPAAIHDLVHRAPEGWQREALTWLWCVRARSNLDCA